MPQRTAVKPDMVGAGRAVFEREIAALKNACSKLGKSFEKAVGLICGCQGRVVVIGLGKSGHIGSKAAATFSSLGIPAFYLHANDALRGEINAIQKNDLVIAMSHSGSTPELLEIIGAIQKSKVQSIVITGKPASPLSQLATVVLDTGVRREADYLNLAPTASTTVTLAITDALAVAVSRSRNFAAEDFARLHPAGALGAAAREKGGRNSLQ